MTYSASCRLLLRRTPAIFSNCDGGWSGDLQLDSLINELLRSEPGGRRSRPLARFISPSPMPPDTVSEVLTHGLTHSFSPPWPVLDSIRLRSERDVVGLWMHTAPRTDGHLSRLDGVTSEISILCSCCWILNSSHLPFLSWDVWIWIRTSQERLHYSLIAATTL